MDSHYVAPCLTLAGNALHVERVARLADVLQAKSTTLAARRTERIEQVTEYGAADVEFVWLLHCIHAAWPLLRFFISHPNQPPERLYAVLAQLASVLMTFSTEAQLSDLPAYDHADAGECDSVRPVAYRLAPPSATYLLGHIDAEPLQVHDDKTLEILSVQANIRRIPNKRAGALEHVPHDGLADLTEIYRNLPASLHGLKKQMEATLLASEPCIRSVDVDIDESGLFGQLRDDVSSEESGACQI